MSDLSVYVTSDITSSERRVSPQWDLHYLKGKLELITGIQPKYQTIRHYRTPTSNQYEVIADAKEYNELSDKNKHISEFNIVPYSRLHVLDTNPESELSNLQDEMNNENIGFKLSEEEYAKRTDSVLNWKRDNKMGRFDPQYHQEKSKILEENMRVSSEMKVGDRCRVMGIQGERRGAVRYVGKIDKLDKGENMWVGIEFDEPVGKNNGSIDGVNIFECREKHGSFIKPKQVEVGDFPELDPFASDDDDEL